MAPGKISAALNAIIAVGLVTLWLRHGLALKAEPPVAASFSHLIQQTNEATQSDHHTATAPITNRHQRMAKAPLAAPLHPSNDGERGRSSLEYTNKENQKSVRVK